MIDRKEIKKYIETAHNKELLKILLWVVTELVWRWDEDEDDDEKREIPLEDLGISVRTFNRLKRAGIDTLEQAFYMSPERLWDMKNIGRHSAIEIVRAMKQHDYDYEKFWNINAERYNGNTRKGI